MSLAGARGLALSGGHDTCTCTVTVSLRLWRSKALLMQCRPHLVLGSAMTTGQGAHGRQGLGPACCTETPSHCQSHFAFLRHRDTLLSHMKTISKSCDPLLLVWRWVRNI
jgi:hypothetical protein